MHSENADVLCVKIGKGACGAKTLMCCEFQLERVCIVKTLMCFELKLERVCIAKVLMCFEL